VRKFRWLLLIAVVVVCLLLWTQMINVMCDQDVSSPGKRISAVKDFLPECQW